MARAPKSAPAPQNEPAALPERIRMLRRYAFYDAAGMHRDWWAGDMVANADDIAVLAQRGGQFEEA